MNSETLSRFKEKAWHYLLVMGKELGMVIRGGNNSVLYFIANNRISSQIPSTFYLLITFISFFSAGTSHCLTEPNFKYNENGDYHSLCQPLALRIYSITIIWMCEFEIPGLIMTIDTQFLTSSVGCPNNSHKHKMWPDFTKHSGFLQGYMVLQQSSDI